MSWVLIVCLAIFAVAVILIERRAVREGDERKRTAPGFVFVTLGVFLLAIGVAAALADDESIALASSGLGLVSVVLGFSRHREVAAH
jgi:hypothetical protein